MIEMIIKVTVPEGDVCGDCIFSFDDDNFESKWPPLKYCILFKQNIYNRKLDCCKKYNEFSVLHEHLIKLKRQIQKDILDIKVPMNGNELEIISQMIDKYIKNEKST